MTNNDMPALLGDDTPRGLRHDSEAYQIVFKPLLCDGRNSIEKEGRQAIFKLVQYAEGKAVELARAEEHIDAVEGERDTYLKALEILGIEAAVATRIARGSICPKCFESWDTHRGDGSCVDSEALVLDEEGALNEYTLHPDHNCVWVTVHNLAVRITRTHVGVDATIYPNGRELSVPLASAVALFSKDE